ncbi:hypothetical protein B0O99DRAFT_524365 [Bisporella sp. PMI_857]|nr:hypothetical protein B0O99DRAFT_524365 [Bisporella sp. PMI_857]
MPALTLYDATVPTFIKGLKTFDHLLTKAEEFAKEKGIDVSTIPQWRLIEDQLPFAFQVQNASKAAQVGVNRLTGVESAAFENNEKTIEDLRKRIQKTLELLKTVDAKTANARGDEKVDRPSEGASKEITVTEGLLNHNLPNFYFHISTGYSILRVKGVQIGKGDYLDSFLGP